MTADIEQIKRKKIPSSLQILYLLSPLPFSPDNFLKVGSPPTQFFRILIPPFRKGVRLGTVCIHLKIYEIIFASFYVFQLEHFDVFWMFLLFLPILIWLFVKILPHFFDNVKHKTGNKFYPPTKSNKPMESLQIKQTQRDAHLLESQHFWVVYTHSL